LATKRNSKAEQGRRADHSGYDWEAARLKFVTTKMTKELVAKEFGIPRNILIKHSTREGWNAERDEYSVTLTKRVVEQSIADKAKFLEQWNEETLVEAQRLREAARRQFMRPLADGRWRFEKHISAVSIQAAASANVSADKLVRLALGVATDNHNTGAKSELPLNIDDFAP
jgi:hypothetical protein